MTLQRRVLRTHSYKSVSRSSPCASRRIGHAYNCLLVGFGNVYRSILLGCSLLHSLAPRCGRLRLPCSERGVHLVAVLSILHTQDQRCSAQVLWIWEFCLRPAVINLAEHRIWLSPVTQWTQCVAQPNSMLSHWVTGGRKSCKSASCRATYL